MFPNTEILHVAVRMTVETCRQWEKALSTYELGLKIVKVTELGGDFVMVFFETVEELPKAA